MRMTFKSWSRDMDGGTRTDAFDSMKPSCVPYMLCGLTTDHVLLFRGMSVLRAADEHPAPLAPSCAVGSDHPPPPPAYEPSPTKLAARNAQDAERHTDQQKAALRLRWELGRQRFAFKVSLDEHARAVAALANVSMWQLIVKCTLLACFWLCNRKGLSISPDHTRGPCYVQCSGCASTFWRFQLLLGHVSALVGRSEDHSTDAPMYEQC